MATSERIEALVRAVRCSVSTLQRHACYGRWQGWGAGTPCCVDELVDVQRLARQPGSGSSGGG